MLYQNGRLTGATKNAQSVIPDAKPYEAHKWDK